MRHMRWEREIVFSFGVILGVDTFLQGNFTLIYLLVLFLKKLWYVLVSSQDGGVATGIYELFRIGSWRMCILSLSFFIPNCLVGMEMIN